jgi:hypothetical protein
MRRLAIALLCAGGVASAQDIEVEGTLGVLDPETVTLVLERHAAGFEACFTEHAGKQRYVGGEARLRLRVARDGTVKRAAAISDIGSWPVEKCLLERARGIRFMVPKGGEAEVDLPFELPPRSESLPGDGQELSGKLGALAACGKGPRRVTVVAYVGPGGRVVAAGFSSEEALATRWGDCAAGKLLALKLRDPRGKVVKVSAEAAR